MKVVNWNVQWATPGSVRSPNILCRIAERSPEIVCLTETDCRLLSAWDGHSIAAISDWGKVAATNRRKVLLWSKREWTNVDDFGSADLPPGRFISAMTETSVGPVTVIGVCIPYHNANVNGGAKNRVTWQDHKTYLDSLSSILKSQSPGPLIVMGDFNQQIGQRRNPYPPLSQPVRCALQETMQAGRPPGLTIATAGLGLRGRRAIDHIAISGDLVAESLATVDNVTQEGRILSDHFGVVAQLSTHSTTPPTTPVE